MDKIDWTKPLELMDGTPVVLQGSAANPDSNGDYHLVREDGRMPTMGQIGLEYQPDYEFIIVKPDGRLWVSPKDVIIRNRADPSVDLEIEVGNISFGEAEVKYCGPVRTDEIPTLRDQFAMAALASMEEKHPPFMAADAYAIADAMLAERNKGN